MMELLVAMALLVGALLPLAYSIVSEKRLARAYYQRAVAMEIVDGEMETLAAGEWATFSSGIHEYPVRAGAATNLPPGRFGDNTASSFIDPKQGCARNVQEEPLCSTMLAICVKSKASVCSLRARQLSTARSLKKGNESPKSPLKIVS